MQNVLLVSAAQASTEQVAAASRLLHSHWPKGGSVAEYQAKLIGDGTTGLLPQSYVLIRNDNDHDKTVVAHGRLIECFESAGGNAAALTYIIAGPQGKGYGSQLVAMLEKEAIGLGYHYLYLWTATAVPFYLKLGYQPTKRVSLYCACLKKLECDQVIKLEAVLQKKMGNMMTKINETVMLPPDEASSGDIWMRKRLVECVGSELITIKMRLPEIRTSISRYTTQASDNIENRISWKYFLLEIPWQQQVGPSCGLAALRMLRDYYVKIDDNCTRMPSLLAEAQRNGYSVDGEIFDASNMVQLATFCGLNAELKSLKQTSEAEVFLLLRQGCTIILPYDSQPTTKRPHLNAGKTAHYGIVVGIMFGFQRNDGNDVEEMRPFRDDENTSHALESLIYCQLLVQHSLSRILAIAPWSEFYESNQQLTTVDRTKYKVPHLNLRDCMIVCKGSERLQ